MLTSHSLSFVPLSSSLTSPLLYPLGPGDRYLESSRSLHFLYKIRPPCAKSVRNPLPTQYLQSAMRFPLDQPSTQERYRDFMSCFDDRRLTTRRMLTSVCLLICAVSGLPIRSWLCVFVVVPARLKLCTLTHVIWTPDLCSHQLANA